MIIKEEFVGEGHINIYLSQIAEKVLNALERKVLRKIYGPVLANGQRRKSYNNKISNFYKEMEITWNIILRTLQWVGHVLKIKDERAPEKALKGYIEGRRPVGRPRGRWIDAVNKQCQEYVTM